MTDIFVLSIVDVMSHLLRMKPQPNLHQNPFMTSTDVRELLAANGVKLTSACLQKWRANGCGPRFVRLTDTPRARVLYPATSVFEWLEERFKVSHTQVTR